MSKFSFLTSISKKLSKGVIAELSFLVRRKEKLLMLFVKFQALVNKKKSTRSRIKQLNRY